jgi:hypothetical protein
MTQVYLVHPRMPALLVLAFDKAAHTFSGQRADGTLIYDPNFHIDIVKRCGYSLTAELPKEFQHAL